MRKLLKINYSLERTSVPRTLKLDKSIASARSYFEGDVFTFLTKKKKFTNGIDWNYSKYGKLWTYNLNYFDFLQQEGNEDSLVLIHDFIANQENITVGFEPYPISLRGINWIKYLSYQEIKDKKISDSLYAQYDRLNSNIEYHLLGNHLLENAFSLLFAAYYFEDEYFYKKSKQILLKELKEQILNDGGHFEQSPMYQQIILFRLLDCINLLKNNTWKSRELLLVLMEFTALMLGWLKNMTFKNGEIPLFNDSTRGIAMTSYELFEYAKRLEIEEKVLPLNESGYRVVNKVKYTCMVDIGDIRASYIPGHVHSDIFNFELYINDKPFIVDMGLSTYETNDQRMLERSTMAHNTVSVGAKNQSQVWGGFRVAKRAAVLKIIEDKDSIKAMHNGYKNRGIIHQRSWKFKDDIIQIEDFLTKKSDAVSYLHFHPSVQKEDILESVIISTKNWKFVTYLYASAFNSLEEALSLEISFENRLNVKIKI